MTATTIDRAPAATTAAPRAESAHGYRADIEGLRAIAILLVVFYHTGTRWAAGGFRGVDAFFVLSGFLITGLLAHEARKTGRVSLSNFWARRARRLMPSAAVVTLVVLITDVFLLNAFDQLTVAKSVRAFAFFASNIFFAATTTQYFGGGGNHQPMLHTWSLSVEEQFYLLFAPLVLGLAVWSARRSTPFMRRLFVTTVLLTVASLVGWYVLMFAYPLVSFFILPSRIWELGFGALAVFAIPHAHRLGRGAAEVIAVVAVAGLLGAGMTSAGTVGTWGATSLVPTLATVALIITGASGRQTLVARGLSTAPMRFIGRVSYDWYLWHWPVLAFVAEVAPQASTRMRMVAGLLALIPATITYQWVTAPIRFSSYLQQRARLVIATAAGVVLAIAGLATLAMGRANRLLDAPAYRPVVASITPPIIYANGCHLSIAQVNSPECLFGPARNDTTIVLFGDSHAAQWFPALDRVAQERGWKLLSLTKSACPSVDVVLFNTQIEREYTECARWRALATARIVALHPTLIVIANTRAYQVMSGDRQLRTDRNREAQQLWGEGVRRTLVALREAHSRIVVLENNPHPAFDVPRCVAKAVNDPAACKPFPLRSVDTVLAPGERAAVATVPGAWYASLNDVLCDSTRCPVMKDGVVRYMDNNHISAPYAEALSPEVSQLLSEALREIPDPSAPHGATP